MVAAVVDWDEQWNRALSAAQEYHEKYMQAEFWLPAELVEFMESLADDLADKMNRGIEAKSSLDSPSTEDTIIES